jgi:hypothetical protein
MPPPLTSSTPRNSSRGRDIGNINLIDSNPDADPDASAQHRERARSPPGSQLLSPTTANPNGQANQNSVLQTTNQTLAHQATQLAHQAPQIRELNNEFLLAYNSLIPNSEFARVHQQMIQERRQQQQLAREEAAKLKERVETALAKAIGWAIAAGSYGSQLPNQTQVLQTIPESVLKTPNSAPEANQNLALEPNTLALQARTLLGNQNSFPQTSNTWTLTPDEHCMYDGEAEKILLAAFRSPGGGSPAPISTKPGSAAAQQQPGEGSPIVPQHQPGGSPAPVSAKPGLAAAQHQPGEGNLAASTPKSRKSIQKSTKNFQKRPKYSRQKVRKFRQILMSKKVIRMVLGRSRKKFSHKNKISNKFQRNVRKSRITSRAWKMH